MQCAIAVDENSGAARKEGERGRERTGFDNGAFPLSLPHTTRNPRLCSYSQGHTPVASPWSLGSTNDRTYSRWRTQEAASPLLFGVPEGQGQVRGSW